MKCPICNNALIVSYTEPTKEDKTRWQCSDNVCFLTHQYNALYQQEIWQNDTWSAESEGDWKAIMRNTQNTIIWSHIKTTIKAIAKFPGIKSYEEIKIWLNSYELIT